MKIIYQNIFLALTLLLMTTVKAQYYYDEKTGEDYPINKNTKKRIIEAFLKEKNATKIEFNKNTGTDLFPFRLKNIKGNWALYQYDSKNDLFLEEESQVYSFQFPSPEMEKSGYTLANRKGKAYLVNLDNPKVESKIGFDAIVPRMATHTTTRYNTGKDVMEHTSYTYIESFTVQENNKWGLIERADGGMFLSHDLLYDSPEEVPQKRGFQSNQFKMMEAIRQEYNIDQLIALDEFGYYFKARDNQTKLWGLFMGEGEVISSVPTKYNDIKLHQNPKTFEVWKDGKVGYYNGNFNVVFEPLFEGFEYIHLDYTHGCALKIDGFWQLFDCHDGSVMVQGKAKTIDQLIELWLDR